MTERKFINPWSDTEGFIDLGTCNLDGEYFELYCFPSRSKQDPYQIGARYGEDENYISSAIFLDCIQPANPRLACYHKAGPIRIAVERMHEKNLFTQNIHDLDGNVIVEI